MQGTKHFEVKRNSAKFKIVQLQLKDLLKKE